MTTAMYRFKPVMGVLTRKGDGARNVLRQGRRDRAAASTRDAVSQTMS